MIIKVSEKLSSPATAQATLTLPFELRQKSRLRALLDDGGEVGLMLPRGEVMRGGDCLRAENGLVIELKAAEEAVSTVACSDTLLLQKACYHLGNRHVPLEISRHGLRYLQDHVLDEMLESLGLSITHETAPFEPEGGAYQQHAHSHSHTHGHHHHD